MKHFTKEVKIGLTGVVAIAALFLGLNFLKGINLFQSSNTYYIAFADIKGLAQSGPVYANGYKIGTVRHIAYDYSRLGNVLVEISIDDQMRLPRGTQGTLVSEMLGGCNLNLVFPASVEAFHQPGDTIQGSDTQGLMDKAAGVLPQVEQIMGKVDSLLTALNTLATNPNITGMLTDAKSITANLNASAEQLNTLMHGDLPRLTGKMNTIGDNVITLTNNLNGIDLQATMSKVDATLAQMQELSERLNSSDNTLGLLLTDTTLYNNLSNTAGSANSLLIDLKEHPKRYVHFSLFGRKQ